MMFNPQLESAIENQFNAVFDIILDFRPTLPANKVQAFVHSAQNLLTNLLSALIYGVLLCLVVWHILPKLYDILPSLLRENLALKVTGLTITFLIFLFTLRVLLVITKFIRAYHVFAFVGIVSTFISLMQGLPNLFGAKGLSEVVGQILQLIKKAVGG